MNYNTEDIIEQHMAPKGKYVKSKKSRIISFLISIVLAVVSANTARNLELKFKTVVEDRPYSTLLEHIWSHYIIGKNPIGEDILLATFIYKTLIYVIIFTIVVKICLGLFLSITKKSIFSLNHPVFFQIINLWNTINLFIIFAIQCYSKLLDVNIIGFVGIDNRQIGLSQAIYEFYNYSKEVFKESYFEFFKKIGLFLIVNIPLMISIIIIVIKSIIRSMVVYISFVPLVFFNIIIYFKFLFEEPIGYKFEKAKDDNYYWVTKFRVRSYSYKFRKYVFCLIIIPAIYLLFIFNPLGMKYPHFTDYKFKNIDINAIIISYFVSGVLLATRYYITSLVRNIVKKLDKQYSYGINFKECKSKS